jgi:hypothetical protein
MWLIDVAGWRNRPQPIINSALWYRRFIGEVIVDLARQNPSSRWIGRFRLIGGKQVIDLT